MTYGREEQLKVKISNCFTLQWTSCNRRKSRNDNSVSKSSSIMKSSSSIFYFLIQFLGPLYLQSLLLAQNQENEKEAMIILFFSFLLNNFIKKFYPVKKKSASMFSLVRALRYHGYLGFYLAILGYYQFSNSVESRWSLMLGL